MAMTKAYALVRLLEHGPLLRCELNEITGWHRPTLANTLWSLASEGRVRRFRAPGSHQHGYRLVTSADVFGIFP
jgi:DNA-binding IclR family transcriptional regulator